MTNKLLMAALAVMVGGCSSPPEPLPVEWDKPAQQMNISLPQWSPNNAVIASPVVTGHWSQHITNFKPENIFTPAVGYAVAHSSQVVISAPDSKSYFSAKYWLRNNGYKGLIEYRSKSQCLTCNNTEIYFYR